MYLHSVSPGNESLSAAFPDGLSFKEWDAETGLYAFPARCYEPRLARWMSVDPEGFELASPMERGQNGELQPKSGYSVIEALNHYSYVGNNPLRCTDPTGEIAEGVWDGISLSIGITSFIMNVKEGNIRGAAVDALGIAVDGAAFALPFVPGGAGAAIKVVRSAQAAVDAVDTVDSCIAVAESIIEGDISGVLIKSAAAITSAAGVGQVSNRLDNAAEKAAQVGRNLSAGSILSPASMPYFKAADNLKKASTAVNTVDAAVNAAQVVDDIID